MNVLLTGGAGYLGSHAAVSLIQAGHRVVLFDSFKNSRVAVPLRISQITGSDVVAVHGDIRNGALLERTLKEHAIEAVGHFAGVKSISESLADPMLYYSVNVEGTIGVLRAMRAAGVKTFLFSSSAAVYGHPVCLPMSEAHPLNPVNPYGRSKYQAEQVLLDLAGSDSEWRIACLRYFNPVGAHESGLIGEDPLSAQVQLLPYIAKVATGELAELTILGGDFATPDGTGIRDFLHVSDVAAGYVAALSFLRENNGCHAFNLGAGNGYSVLDVVRCFEKVSGKLIPRRFLPRRPNDVPVYYADTTKAARLLGWSSSRSLLEMCRSAWAWEKQSFGLASIINSVEEEVAC